MARPSVCKAMELNFEILELTDPRGDANFDCSFSMGGLICTARGRYLTVLGHEGKTELQMNSVVDTVCISPDYSLLLLGLRNGHLLMYHLQLKAFFGKELVSVEEDKECDRTFVKLEYSPESASVSKGHCSVLALLRSGMLFVISGIPNGCDLEALGDPKTLINQLQVTRIPMEGVVHATFKTARTIICSDAKPSLTILEKTDKRELNFGPIVCISKVLQGSIVQKILFPPDALLMITLLDDGSLAVWNTLFFVVTSLWSNREKVLDILFWKPSVGGDEPAGSKFAPTPFLCCLVETCKVERSLYILKLPELVAVTTVDVSSQCLHLIESGVPQNYFCFIERGHEDNTCQIRKVTEMNIRNKLFGLIDAHKYEEAEAYAGANCLDKHDLYKKKALHLLNSGGPLSDVMTCLDCIEDVEYTSEFCFAAETEDLSSTLELLRYAEKRISSMPDSQAENRILLLSTARNKLSKLSSFNLILGLQPFNFKMWNLFSSAGLTDVLKLLLEQGKIGEATLIWQKHQKELLQELDVSTFCEMLQVVPVDVSTRSLSSFAGVVLPFLIQHVPKPLDYFISWITDRITNSLQRDSSEWIVDSLKVLREILSQFTKSLEQQTRLPPLLAVCAEPKDFLWSSLKTPLEQLNKSIRNLEELNYIHHHLQIADVELEHISENTTEELVFMMMDRIIAPEQIAHVVQSQVVQYCDRHKLAVDSVLVQYVKNFLQNVPQYHLPLHDVHCEGLEDLPWEIKTLAIVDCIESSESYLEAVCEIAKFARIPWSKAVEAAVQKALQLKLPLVTELKRRCKLAKWKKVGWTYGLTTAELENRPKSNPKWIAKKIIRSGSPTAIDDIIEVADMCSLAPEDVYSMYVQHLTRTDKLDDVEVFLDTLSTPQAVAVAERLVLQALEVSCAEFVRLAITGVRHLMSRGFQALSVYQWSHLPLSDVASMLDNLLVLHEEFAEKPNFISLLDAGFCKQQVKGLISSSSSPCDDVCLKKLIRYARCYGLGEMWLLGELMLQFVRNGQIEEASKICHKLQSLDFQPGEEKHVCQIVEAVWSGLSACDKHYYTSPSLSLLLDELLVLSDRAVVSCKDDDLVVLLEVSTAIRIMTAVDVQCSVLDTAAPDSEKLLTSLRKEVLDPIYQEEALMMEQEQILPLVAQFQLAKGCFCQSGGIWTNFHTDEFLEKSQVIVSLLRDNGLYHNSLCVAQETLHTLDHRLPESEDLALLKGKGQELIDSIIKSSTEAVLRSPKLDHLYGITLLLSVDESEALKMLLSSRKTCKGYTKIMALSDLTVHFGEVVGRSDLVSTAVGYYHTAKWGKILRDYKIDYSGALKANRQDVEMSTLWELMRRKDVPMNIVMEYSSDMRQSMPDIPAEYLLSVLTNWDEGYEQRSCALLQLLTHSKANECLVDACTKVSPYDYERLEFILQQLESLEEKHPQGSLEDIVKNLAILKWLKFYERQAPPSEYEVTYCKELGSAGSSVQVSKEGRWATTRLPYHPCIWGNSRKIIDPELNLCSVESLLHLASLLQIPSNDIFVVTIKNVASKMQQLETPAESRQVMSSLEEIFERITNPHLAVACGQWLKHVLKGEYRIQMLRKTVHFARCWLSISTTEEERLRASGELEGLVQEVKTSTVLHLFEESGLDPQDVLELIARPEDLIAHLYIEQSNKASAPLEVLKVHKIARETAAILQVNIKMVKKNLLNTWLHMATAAEENPLNATLDTTQLSLDETLHTANADEEPNDSLCKEDEYFKRLVFLTSEEDEIEENVTTLLNYAKRSSSSFPYKCRVLALRLVLHIASCDLVEKITKRGIADIVHLQQVFHFLSELESVHVNTTLQSYESCDKLAFTKMLFKTRGHQPKALHIVVNMLAFHEIFDDTLWNNVLRQLIDLKQTKTLRRAVVWLLKTSPPNIQMQALCDAWDCVLRWPLMDAELPLTAKLRDSLLDAFSLLLICPCLFTLDMKYFVKAFCQLQMPECALVCAQLFPSSTERNILLKNIVKSLDSTKQVKMRLEKLDVPREVVEAISLHLGDDDGLSESVSMDSSVYI